MAFKFSRRSERRLRGVHPDLIKVVRRALEITGVDFSVIEGMRTLKRQRALMARGASTTLRSRHLTGHAVDIAPYIDGTIRWDWPPFYKLADAMKQAAKELDVDLEWGGDWEDFMDGPHFQLSWKAYPA